MFRGKGLDILVRELHRCRYGYSQAWVQILNLSIWVPITDMTGTPGLKKMKMKQCAYYYLTICAWHNPVQSRSSMRMNRIMTWVLEAIMKIFSWKQLERNLNYLVLSLGMNWGEASGKANVGEDGGLVKKRNLIIEGGLREIKGNWTMKKEKPTTNLIKNSMDWQH